MKRKKQTITLTIRKKHVEQAIEARGRGELLSKSCPIAQALREKGGDWNVGYLGAHKLSACETESYVLPEALQKIVSKWGFFDKKDHLVTEFKLGTYKLRKAEEGEEVD